MPATIPPAQPFQPDRSCPLDGLRVLDFSRLVAGNMLTLQLADFGAEVIKLEPASGDPLRAWRENGVAAYWKVYGRNTEKVARLNPKLVFVRISGFGQTGPYAQRPGNRASITAPRNIYQTADHGWVALSASTQAMTERLFRAIGREDMLDDPRFRTNADRLAHVDEVDAAVGAFIGARSLAENLAFFEEAEVTVGPVYDASGFETDPHVQGRGVLVEMEDAELGSIPMHAVVPRLSGTPGALRRPAPALGQDEKDILASLEAP